AFETAQSERAEGVGESVHSQRIAREKIHHKPRPRAPEERMSERADVEAHQRQKRGKHQNWQLGVDRGLKPEENDAQSKTEDNHVHLPCQAQADWTRVARSEWRGIQPSRRAAFAGSAVSTAGSPE